MMKHFFVILIGCLWLAIPLFAQSNKLIRELESKRGALQKQISETESILKQRERGGRLGVHPEPCRRTRCAAALLLRCAGGLADP